MTNLYAKTGRTYRPATRVDVSNWMQAAVAAEAPGAIVNNPADAEAYFTEALRGSPAEAFAVLYLNSRLRVLAFEIAFRGTIDQTSVHPREIVRRVMDLNAAAVIFGHNHPSGEPTPSDADHMITRRLRAALELVDVRILDHFVIGSSSNVSLAAMGPL